MRVQVANGESSKLHAIGALDRSISGKLTFFRHNLTFYREKRGRSIGYDPGRRSGTRLTNRLTGWPQMSHNIVFFSVHADDLPRAQQFYGKVFGWRFEPWGPPGFFLVATGHADDPGIQGSLQKRHEVVPGKRLFGYECTISVDDIDAAAAAVTAHGGKIIFPKCEIPTVGWLIKIEDPEGNIVCVKQPAEAHA
jgi:predicted enzyme related to lactoylglutathione lyase